MNPAGPVRSGPDRGIVTVPAVLGNESDDGRRETENRVAASAILGSIVQAANISGGIHIHSQPEQQQSARFLPKQLPPAVRGFVNRFREIVRLRRSLGSPEAEASPSVIVIVGSAGVGKTALALHWLHSIRDDFTDGDLFLNLRGYDADRPVPAIASLERMLRDLGVPPNQIPSGLDDRARLFRSLIAGRRILILLDNASSASQVQPLIPGAAGPLLVVTSRSRMPGLAVRVGVTYVKVDVLHESDAAALVRAVTESERPGDTEADVADLVRLCARLPLALRIVAERAASRPAMLLSDLIEDLSDRSGLWEALSIADGSEVDDVRSVFAWSFRALPEQASWIFRVIGLHPGLDISLAAVAAAAGTSLREARRSTDVLVGAFLLDHVAGSRFQMHDLLRAYAEAEATARDSALTRRAVFDRMFNWYARSADNASAMLAPDDRLVPSRTLATDTIPTAFGSADEALAWFEAERQNLLAAARMAEVSNMPDHAFALALAPCPIYMNYFFFDDWAEMSLAALRSVAGGPNVRDAALANENRGKYLLRSGQYEESRAAFAEALQMFEQAGDRRGSAEAMNSLGLVCLRLRDLESAVGLFESAADRFTDLQDIRWQCVCRSNLAEVRIERGDLSAALAELTDLLQVFGNLGDTAMKGNTLWLVAWAHRLEGDLVGARNAIEGALAIAEEARNKMWEGFWLIEAARIQLDLNQTEEALLSCQLAASLERQIGDLSREAMVFHCVGDVCQRMGNWTDAAAFYSQASRQFDSLGERWNEALSRLGAATAASAMERFGVERDQLDLAYGLLEPYTDAIAVALRQDIRARLG